MRRPGTTETHTLVIILTVTGALLASCADTAGGELCKSADSDDNADDLSDPSTICE